MVVDQILLFSLMVVDEKEDLSSSYVLAVVLLDVPSAASLPAKIYGCKGNAKLQTLVGVKRIQKIAGKVPIIDNEETILERVVLSDDRREQFSLFV